MNLMEPKINLVRQFFNLRLDGSIKEHHLVITVGFTDTRFYITINLFVDMQMYSKCSECSCNDISLIYILITFHKVIYWEKKPTCIFCFFSSYTLVL